MVIEYLLEENKVLKEHLQKRGQRILLTDAQRRRIAKKGKGLGWKVLQQYATIATPETILAWHRKLVAMKYTAKRGINTARQAMMAVVRELAVKFAEVPRSVATTRARWRQNPSWGYGRIQGALSNLGYEVCETTVGNILRAKGIFPAPERMKRSNWGRFVRSHLSVMSVADFFTTEVWTMRGLVRYHTLFVMKLATREAHIAHIGCQVNGQVMNQVARNLTDCFDGFLVGQNYFVCDHDSLFTPTFRKMLSDQGIDVIQTRVGCPEQNGYAESFVRAIKSECVERLIFFGENSLRKAISEYVKHFHHERNHQGLENVIPFPQPAPEKERASTIAKSERLGGLLNYYYREPPPESRKDGHEKAA